ncbi:hypothetical protein BHU72_02245 [Desulfuribacillus stibiiarsenatis]|uniref:HTH arsR-type domain-containing protein n=1 Tax=Desulfuribacillus stibiiarsenatis TaxID=1390249 RepID=A0A1E5L7K2_9FIRM|nr:metalloregulator ArsR/SmtB family transcription factor [Desulfuribacillus stibiiarsenatis]OEH85943.1 hypothetical protein BHU72_02245 [Desulfuribacillus stibiiarsenatis]
MNLRVEMLKALADETRLQILSMLYVRDCCVCELTYGLEKTQPSISQHLRKMKHAGLVTENKQGSWVIYSLRKDIPQWIHLLLQEVNKPEEIFHKIQQSDLNLPCSLQGKITNC